MKKKLLPIFSFIVLLSSIFSLTSCGSSQKTFEKLEDFKGCQIGVLSGTAFNEFISSSVIGEDYDPVYYSSYDTMMIDTINGKIDGYITDEPIGKYQTTMQPALTIFSQKLAYDSYGYIFPKNSPLVTPVNEIITKYKQNGLFDEISQKWFTYTSEEKTVPTQEELSPGFVGKGDLVFGSSGQQMPFSYLSNGNTIGFDMEMAIRITTDLGYTYKGISNFGGSSNIVSAVVSGKVDWGGTCSSITEERKKVVDFSSAYYEGGPVFVIKDTATVIDGPEGLYNKKVAVLIGSTFEEAVKESAPGATTYSYNTISDCLQAISSGKVSAAILDSPTANYVVSTIDGYRVTTKPLSDQEVNYAFAIRKDNTTLLSEMNIFLAALKESGEMTRLQEKWFLGKEERKLDINDYNFGDKVITCVSAGDVAPFTYMDNGTAIGYDHEVLYMFCEEYGYRPSLATASFSSLIAGIGSKYDLGFSGITPTEERMKMVNFTIPDCEPGNFAIIVSSQTKGVSFFESIWNSIYSTLIKDNRWLQFVKGYGVTLLITFGSLFLGTLLGAGLCYLRSRKTKFATIPSTVYIRIMQGVPIVVILMVLYYVIFARVDITPILIAIFGFALSFGAYVSEILTSGIASVDKGEIEASLSMGFTRMQTMKNITLPQALKNCLPVYMQEAVSTMKMTSVVGYIAIVDLTRVSDLIRAVTYEAFFPLIVVSIIYFLSSWGMITLSKVIMKKINRENSKDKIKIKGVTLDE